jgi:hypothetical protein
MPFKLPDRPTTRAHSHELADFAEIQTLLRHSFSSTELQRFLSRIDDNFENEGIVDDDVANEDLSDKVMQEIESRLNACPEGYPFEMNMAGMHISIRDAVSANQAKVYRYLLLATRLDMNANRVQNSIDGALLMEELGASALRQYLGGMRARTIVFGTAQAGSFSAKVTKLCSEFREGGIFNNPNLGPVTRNDDGLDVVGWIPFSDVLPSKICVFAQCKTGTSWRDDTTKLVPSTFIKKWMTGSFALDPVKAYIIAESVSRDYWNTTSIESGVLIDRCRIVDFSTDIDTDLITRIESWTDGAMQYLRNNGWVDSL